MAAAEARRMWQRTAAKSHFRQEDANRSPKFVECPLPHIVTRSQADTRNPVGYSYFWSNSWGSVDPRFSPESKLDLQWQFSPSTHKDYSSELSGLDESLSTRFSKPTGLQSLAADSTLKRVPGLMGSGSGYTAAELDFEWQLIVDPQPEPGLAGPKYDTDICKDNQKLKFVEAIRRDANNDEQERVQEVNTGDVGTSEMMMTRSNYEVGSYGSHSGSSLGKGQALALQLGAVSEHQDKSSKSLMTRNLFWEVADKEAWARLVPQQVVTLEVMESCDLPCPEARLMPEAASTSFEINPSIERQGVVSQSLEQNLLASLMRGSEPTHLENVDLSLSSPLLGSLDPSPWPAAPVQSQRVSEPLTTPSIEAPSIRRASHSFSIDSTNNSSIGGAVKMDRGPGLLGEALCRSQTRAREAEKKVQRVYEEKELLMHMFFKEASLAFTYRQWVTSLQTENMWLRMSYRHEPVAWLQHSIFNPLTALERISSKRSKRAGQDYHTRCHMDQNMTAMWHAKHLVYLGNPDDIMMGYTIAFAFGLSLAGAGLMLGWSMGWILLAY